MTDVFALLERAGVLPVVVLDDAADAEPLGAALVSGGLRCAEVTFRTAAAEQAIAMMARDPSLLVGAGTVVAGEQARRAVEAGARFVVSPGFDRELVRECRRLDVPIIPGVATATELQSAARAGVDVVKLFPARLLGGPRMVGALAAPFAGMRFVPTGGIRADDIGAYLTQPAVLAVGGSWLGAPELLRERDWDEVGRLAAEAAALAAAARDGAA